MRFRTRCYLTHAQACTKLCVVPNPSTVTKREAADILGVNPSTVQRMIDNGRLEATSIGDSTRPAMYLIRRSHVERLARQRKAAA